MTEMVDDSPRTGPSALFWAIAVVSLLWNAFGGYDYTMSHLQGEAYFRQMGMNDAQIAFYDTYPAWMTAVWAIGVWGSVAGSILLLLRMRWAFHAFALSLAGLIVSLLYTYGSATGRETMGAGWPMSALILAVCLFLVWYSRRMTKAGVLR